MVSPPQPLVLVKGTLDLLILKALSLEPLHGLGVSRRVEQISAKPRIQESEQRRPSSPVVAVLFRRRP